MLRLRLLTGFVGVPILVALAVLGGVWALLGVMIPVIIGTLEMYTMLQGAGYRPLVPVGVVLAAAFVLDGAFAEYRIVYTALPVGAVLALGWAASRSDLANAIVDWALTLTPAIYVGGLLQFFMPLRAMPDGLLWVLMVLVATWFCDSVAYFVGRAAGRTRLAPRISPAKSVEGALAGVAAAVLIGLVAAAITGLPYWRLAGLGLVIGACAVAGDLLESFIKRQCGAKDSSALVPGHGGMLDRMDSLLLSVAGGYFFVVWTA